MTVHDVLVVGGGPAGSTLAWALRREGLDVAVLDRRTFPRDKVCAGWITPAVVRSLDLDVDAYARDRVLQPIHGFRVGVIGGRPTDVRFAGGPVSYGIRRCEFDHYLLERSGAELRLGAPLRELRRDDGIWVANDEIGAKLIVGAGGHACPVARRLGARPGRQERAIVAQEIEFEMTPTQRASCAAEGEVPELYFCRDLGGYGWIFRKGNHLNVGLGRDDPHALTGHVRSFLERLIAEGRIPGDTPRKLDGHAYLLYSHAPRRLVGHGALLVGDAAGLAEPHSGEGIRPAVESALLAAEVIVEARGNYGEERLATYAERLVRRFGQRRSGPEVGDLLPRALRRMLGRRLLASEWFARRVVLGQWFLQLHRPPVVAPSLAVGGHG